MAAGSSEKASWSNVHQAIQNFGVLVRLYEKKDTEAATWITKEAYSTLSKIVELAKTWMSEYTGESTEFKDAELRKFVGHIETLRRAVGIRCDKLKDKGAIDGRVREDVFHKELELSGKISKLVSELKLTSERARDQFMINCYHNPVNYGPAYRLADDILSKIELEETTLDEASVETKKNLTKILEKETEATSETK